MSALLVHVSCKCLIGLVVFVQLANGQSLNHTLIESTILINLNNLNSSSQNSSFRRALDNLEESRIESSISSDGIALTDVDDLQNALSEIYNSIPIEDRIDALSHSIKYLAEKRIAFDLNDDDFANGIKSITKAFLNDSSSDNEISMLTDTLFTSIIPTELMNWEKNAKTWSNTAANWVARLTSILIETVPLNKLTAVNESVVSTVFSIFKDSGSIPSIGLYGGITPIDNHSEANDEMKFDGLLKDYMKFDPIKSHLFSLASFNISKSFTTRKDFLTVDKIEELSKELARSTIPIILQEISLLDGDNSLFAYELSKVMSENLVKGAVTSIISDDSYNSQEFPSLLTEELSFYIANEAITESLNIDSENWEIAKIAESLSRGTMIGAQMAAIHEKSLDYTAGWESYERKQLAKSSAFGSSKGASEARFKYWDDANPNMKEELAPQARFDLVQISHSSAVGSMIGGVAMSNYFPHPNDNIALINFAAQGTTAGSMNGIIGDISDQDSTESFEIEIARASSHGATLGASFQTVALTNANPDSKTADRLTLDSVQAATYGSTFGAIAGIGDKSNSSTEPKDSLILKQATKQGSIEGALLGSSLGSGYAVDSENEKNIRSRSAIIKSVAETNANAAQSANSNKATKAIKTSTNDMLKLMKKFNINPRFTNPTKVFKTRIIKNEEEDFPVEDQLKVASPI